MAGPISHRTTRSRSTSTNPAKGELVGRGLNGLAAHGRRRDHGLGACYLLRPAGTLITLGGSKAHWRSNVSYLAQAWSELHDATPPGWEMGRTAFHEYRNEWQQFA